MYNISERTTTKMIQMGLIYKCMNSCGKTTSNGVGIRASSGGRGVSIRPRKKGQGRMVRRTGERGLCRVGHLEDSDFQSRRKASSRRPDKEGARMNTLISLSSFPPVSCWGFVLSEPNRKPEGKGIS